MKVNHTLNQMLIQCIPAACALLYHSDVIAVASVKPAPAFSSVISMVTFGSMATSRKWQHITNAILLKTTKVATSLTELMTL